MRFRTILAGALALAALLVHPAAEARADAPQVWFVVHIGAESMDLLDTGSVSDAGPYKRAWAGSIFVQPIDSPRGGGPAVFLSTYFEFDCASRRIRPIGVRFRNEPFDTVFTYDGPGDWVDVQPNTEGELELQVVCGLRPVAAKDTLTGALTDLRGPYLKTREGRTP